MRKISFLLFAVTLLGLSPVLARAQSNLYPGGNPNASRPNGPGVATGSAGGHDTTSAGNATGCDAEAGTGFTCSPHDFSGKNAGNPGGDMGITTGACTICHTPHRALQTRLLWNHTLSTNTFTWDSAFTIGGTAMPSIDASWSGPSKFCLSCHDGSVAIGDIAWFNEKTWNGAGDHITTNAGYAGGEKHDNAADEFRIANGGDLSGNHPVAFPYPNYSGATSTYNGVTTGLNVNKLDFSQDPTQYGIRLFNDSGANGVTAGAVGGKTGIECTSCHGVHNEKGLVYDMPLLRGMRSGNTTGAGASYICMKCHTR